jgi:hypothetical protein
MLAIIYLVAATHFGNLLARRFFRFHSIQHRLATAFLVGLLLSTWITFLAALLFHGTRQPLIAANVLFLVLFAVVVFASRRWPAKNDDNWPPGHLYWDLIWLAACSVFACWLMFATLGFKDGQFQIAFKAWTDFGANVSLTQSFALGKNFPPQHPFFPGEFIRYHFLFWFQTANLEFLGLNPVWSINLLSLMSLVALMILIATFGEVLFKSRVVGRIGAALFFFSSSLSYLPFLRSQSGIQGALNAIVGGTEFLPSGYPFRGETWGVLSANVFAYQRHLISGIGLFFVALVFAVDEYQRRAAIKKEQPRQTILPVANEPESDAIPPSPAEVDASAEVDLSAQTRTLAVVPSWIFAGALIGLLPYWNSPTFIAGLTVFGCLLVLVPLPSRTALLLVSAIVFGLPQVLMLRSGNTTAYSLFNPGYTLENVSFWLIVKYLAWTFGVKWILLWVALVFATGFQRKLLVAFTSLVAIVFLFQLSVDVFNNHKLLNIWATCVNVYAAYALWQIAKQKIIGPVLAVLLTIATVFGGVMDLFPLHNDPMLAVPYNNDRLSEWLMTNTQPSDIFLTHTLLTHPILFSGRKIYLGYTLFAWTAGYNVPDREAIYRQMFQENDVEELKRLLHNNNIAYVAIDDGVRHNESLPDLNEYTFDQNFQKVFEDTAHVYDNVVIYKVPSAARP